MNVDAEVAAFLQREFKKAGKKLDMGKSCVRFKSLDDLPLDAIGAVVARTPPEEHIARAEASWSHRSKRPAKRKA
jgi:hypothetical protein